MKTYESADLAGLERAIRSLAPVRAPDGLRIALRHELLAAASARQAHRPFAALFPSVRRIAFAVVATFFLMSGWAIAASAPGDLGYPIKEAIVRLIFPSERQERVPMDRDVIEMPPTTPGAPTTPQPDPAAPMVPDLPLVPDVPLAPEVPLDVPLPTAGPDVPTGSTGPARATPAIPPDPAGPRATPALPPPHR